MVSRKSYLFLCRREHKIAEWHVLANFRGGRFFHSKGTKGCAVPPARVYFFKLSSPAKGILLPILVHLVWARVCFLAIAAVKEMSNFDDSCKEKLKFFFKFWSRECKNLASFV